MFLAFARASFDILLFFAGAKKLGTAADTVTAGINFPSCSELQVGVGAGNDQ